MKNNPPVIVISRAFLFILSALLLSPAMVFSEVTEHGGRAERFKGEVDRTPPKCQLDVPTASAEPFFVKWNCRDNASEPDEIRTELWIYRKGEAAGELLSSFLGFPASVQIDAGVLKVEEFTDGLPVGFRLYARDRGGLGMVTPIRTVASQDNTVDQCSLLIQTEATESTGGTTGVPALSVSLQDVSVLSRESSEGELSLYTPSKTTANPCEISSVCKNDDKVSFAATITLVEGGQASGPVAVSPGDVAAEAQGTWSSSGAVITSLELTGTTEIDGVQATLTLTCSR